MTSRYGIDPRRASTRSSPSGASRATAPTRCGTPSTASRSRSTTPPRSRARSASASTDALPLALDVAHRADRARRHDDRSGCGRARRDGAQIETVLMRYPERATVCVSSQAGCAMGCTFCATGQAGFERHLDAGEIVEQVRARRARVARNASATSCSWAWANRSRTTTTRGPRSTASTTTSGCRRGASPSAPSASRPAIRRLAGEDLPVTLAVSLHAPTDDERERARPAQPPLPDRRGARRRRRVRGRQGPAGHLRVRLHRRRERLARPGRGARAAARRLPGRRRRPREPDPAQPHRRLRRARAARRRRCGPSPTGCGPTG